MQFKIIKVTSNPEYLADQRTPSINVKILPLFLNNCYLSYGNFTYKQLLSVVMPGDRCIVCGNSRAKDLSASFHRFPSDLSKKQLWIQEFGLLEGTVKPFSRVCSRHFRNGDPNNGPDKTLGARFASPKKRGTPRS